MREIVLIPGLTQPEPILGVGWNWFDHLGIGGHYARSQGYPLDAVVHPEPDTPAWADLERRLEEVRPALIRFGIPPDAHCDGAGRFHVGTASWRRLTALDRWAQRAGAAIILDPFLIPAAHELPRPAGKDAVGDHIVNMAPRDPAAYARDFVAPMLRRVVDDGMASVRWFNPVNEPNEYGVWQVPAGHPQSAWAVYVEMLRAIRTACDAAGVPRSRVGLLGLDASSNLYPLLDLLAEGLDPDPWIDGYSRHYYSLRFDHLPPADGSWTTPMADTLDRGTAQLVRYARARRKPVIAAEIGTFHYGWRLGDPAGAASPEAVLTVCEGIIRALACGVAGACTWSLFNPDTIDGWWANLRVDGDRIVPAGRGWDCYGMIAAACRPGARLTALRCEPASVLPHVHGILLDTKDGPRALLVNDHATEPARVRIRLTPGGTGGTWTARTSDRVRRQEPRPLTLADGHVIVELPPLSLTCATG
jgi:hypothetical protein